MKCWHRTWVTVPSDCVSFRYGTKTVNFTRFLIEPHTPMTKYSAPYVFFLLIPRRLGSNSRRFGTLYRFHLHAQVDEEWLGMGRAATWIVSSEEPSKLRCIQTTSTEMQDSASSNPGNHCYIDSRKADSHSVHNSDPTRTRTIYTSPFHNLLWLHPPFRSLSLPLAPPLSPPQPLQV